MGATGGTRRFGRVLAGVATVAVLAAACGSGGTTIADGTEPVGTVATTTPVTAAVVRADDLAVAHTPEGGWTEVPPPVLATCTEPLVAGAPDLRGWWEIVEVEVAGVVDPSHRGLGLRQRIEQCGDRLVVTASGIVHDMRVDGTEERGVHDVAEMDKTTPIVVVATYEDGVHVLRPVGVPVEVRRRREGDQLVWDYVGFTARLDRLGPPEVEPPPPA